MQAPGMVEVFWQVLVPPRCILRKAGTLDSDDTKALSCRGLHDNPAFQPTDDFRPQLLKAGHLDWNVVRSALSWLKPRSWPPRSTRSRRSPRHAGSTARG